MNGLADNFNDIMGALENHLRSMPKDVDVLWPNVKMDIRDDLEYLVADHLFGQTFAACLGDGGKNITNGIFQVTAMTPQNKGRSSLLDPVERHFKRGTVLQQNSVKLRIVSVSKEPSFQDGNHYRQPLSVRWQVFTV